MVPRAGSNHRHCDFQSLDVAFERPLLERWRSWLRKFLSEKPRVLLSFSDIRLLVTNANVLATTEIACAPGAPRKTFGGAPPRTDGLGAHRERTMPIITDTLIKAKKPPAAGRIEIKDDR